MRQAVSPVDSSLQVRTRPHRVRLSVTPYAEDIEHRILTIGHATRNLDHFIAILRSHAVDRLIDVRTVPRSRTNPQFNRDTLPDALARHPIAYEHDPRLGGLLLRNSGPATEHIIALADNAPPVHGE